MNTIIGKTNGFNVKNDRAVIITSHVEGHPDMGALIGDGDFVICADGGYDIALSHGIRPDLLLGDFDSTQLPLPDDIRIVRFSPEKDYTDLDLAIRTAAEEGFSQLTIIGGIGGRLDHTVANLQLLYRYHDSFDSLVMADGLDRCFILDSKKRGSAVLRGEPGRYLSVFSLSENSYGVTISGAKYELSGHTLTRDFPLGVSNEFNEKQDAVITVDDGILLIVISDMRHV